MSVATNSGSEFRLPPSSAPPRTLLHPHREEFDVRATRRPVRRNLPLSKRFEKQKRRNGRSFATAEIIELHRPDKFETERALPPIKALNPTQADYLDALRRSPQVVVLGPAGTGKTWIAAAYAIALKRGDIEMVPFEVMRGRSWKDAFVLLDEAQNTTPAEIKTFLTRIGEDCSVVVNGDVSQCDLGEASGLRAVLDLIRARGLPVPVIEFTLDDIVRSGICAMWVRAFEEARI
jgi:phosphate starvation-inducible protein PhoH